MAPHHITMNSRLGTQTHLLLLCHIKFWSTWCINISWINTIIFIHISETDTQLTLAWKNKRIEGKESKEIRGRARNKKHRVLLTPKNAIPCIQASHDRRLPIFLVITASQAHWKRHPLNVSIGHNCRGIHLLFLESFIRSNSVLSGRRRLLSRLLSVMDLALFSLNHICSNSQHNIQYVRK